MSAFLPTGRICKHGTCYGNVAGCLSVTCRYCIKMAKPILKLSRPSGRPILFLLTPMPIPNSKGNPFSGGYKYTGWEKLSIFDGNLRLSWKRCEIGRWLLWSVNRKSWVPDRIVSFLMTLRDAKPGFQGHCIFASRISQNRCILGTKLLKNTNRKPYTIYLMVNDLEWPITLISRSQHFLTLNISETTRDRAMFTIERQ